MMINLIAHLLYATDQHVLDLSVEESWSCPPMPTRAYWKGESFLTQPKPDLAVCFTRLTLIPNHQWNNLPMATKRLACYESADESGGQKLFHFFTIEASNANTSTGDMVGLRQNLNNASQALHNMFEFFREAGSYQEDVFFAKVRFFSVAASTEGITIRIHRAIRQPTYSESDQGFIIPEYPLRFEYNEFCSIPRHKFEQDTVLETFEKILSYAAKELCPLLEDTAKRVVVKLENDANEMYSRGDENFYRYEQTATSRGPRTTRTN